jgi:asparagine N-glycosylation enzyme membrane subunit Stt3
MSDVFGISLRMWLGILFTAAVVLLTVLVYLVSIIARRGYASGSLTADRATSLYRTIIYALFASSAGAIYALVPFSIAVGALGVIVGIIALRRRLLEN